MNSAHDKHGTAPPAYNKAFGFGIALNAAYIVVQVIVGLAIQSMALLADAGHNTADILSLGLAWGASHLGQSKPSRRRTYGLRRTSILASLANAIILLIATGAIGLESARRFAHPHSVPGGTWSSRTGGLMTGC